MGSFSCTTMCISKNIHFDWIFQKNESCYFAEMLHAWEPIFLHPRPDTGGQRSLWDSYRRTSLWRSHRYLRSDRGWYQYTRSCRSCSFLLHNPTSSHKHNLELRYYLLYMFQNGRCATNTWAMCMLRGWERLRMRQSFSSCSPEWWSHTTELFLDIWWPYPHLDRYTWQTRHSQTGGWQGLPQKYTQRSPGPG